MPTSHETMTCHPTEPVIRHVLVSRYPGLVINWQYTPVHNATAPSWTALVLIAPFPEATWSSTSALTAWSWCAIPSPPMDDDTPKRRQVWVDASSGHQ